MANENNKEVANSLNKYNEYKNIILTFKLNKSCQLIQFYKTYIS